MTVDVFSDQEYINTNVDIFLEEFNSFVLMIYIHQYSSSVEDF